MSIDSDVKFKTGDLLLYTWSKDLIDYDIDLILNMRHESDDVHITILSFKRDEDSAPGIEIEMLSIPMTHFDPNDWIKLNEH